MVVRLRANLSVQDKLCCINFRKMTTLPSRIMDNVTSYVLYNRSSPTVKSLNLDPPATESPDDIWLKGILFQIRMCFLPIVLGGTITNILNFVLLSRRDMRRLSTSVYLFNLALADLGVMYLELFRVWFEWANIVDPAIYFTDVYCKLVNYTNGVTRDFSNWLVACLTLERVVMVACPYRAKTFCTVRRAKIVSGSLLGAICVPHLHSLVFSVAQKKTWWVCWEDPATPAASILAAIVEFSVGYSVVLVVLFLNVILVSLIYRNKLPVLVGGGGTHCNGTRRTINRRLTRTLLVVALVFIVCETPRIIISFICRFLQRTPTRRIVLNLSFLLSGINHACNFFIYIVASPRFRRNLLLTFPFSTLPFAHAAAFKPPSSRRRRARPREETEMNLRRNSANNRFLSPVANGILGRAPDEVEASGRATFTHSDLALRDGVSSSLARPASR